MRSFIVLLALSGIACGSDSDPVNERDERILDVNEFEADKDIKIEMYTQSDANLQSYDPSKINSDWPTVIFIHGYTTGDMHTKMQKAYFGGENQAKVNLIRINWENGANHLRYKISANRTQDVGRYVGEFIHKFAYVPETKVTDLNLVTLVGHSLGAQTAGVAGATFAELSGGEKLPVIIGLDPARPAFEISSPYLKKKSPLAPFVNALSDKVNKLAQTGIVPGLQLIADTLEKTEVFLNETFLNHTHAEKVLVIHTNPGGFGFLKKCGHTDIYFKYDHAEKCKVDAGILGSFFSLNPFEAVTTFSNVQNIAQLGTIDAFANFFEIAESRLISTCDHGFANDYFANAMNKSRANGDEQYKNPYEWLQTYSNSKVVEKYKSVVNPSCEPIIDTSLFKKGLIWKC